MRHPRPSQKLAPVLLAALFVPWTAAQSLPGAPSPPDAQENDDWNHEGRISAGLSVTRGNTRTESGQLALDHRSRSPRNRVLASAEGNRARDDGELSVYNLRGSLRHDYFLTRRLYLNSSASLLRDEFRDIRLRRTVGFGPGVQLLDAERVQLSAETGLSYIHETRYVQDTQREPAWRWAMDYQQELESGVTLFHRQEGLVVLDEPKDWVWSSRTGLRFPVIGDLAGSIQYQYDYDNQPAEDRKAYDSALLLNVNWTW